MMDEEAILTSLYENIEVYTEAKNLMKNLIKGFENYFGVTEFEGELALEIKLLIQHSAFDIQSFKEKVIEVLHNLLLSDDFKFDRTMCLEKNYLITLSKEIKKALEDTLFLYQHEFLLELTGFLNNNKNLKLSEDLKTLTTEHFSNNLTYFYECIEKSIEEIGLLIEDNISDYEVFVWNIKKLLLENTKKKDVLDEKMYIDKILSIRDLFINTTDNVIVSLIKDINYIILISFSEKIRQELLGGLKDKLDYYERALKEYLELQANFEQKNKSIKICYGVNVSQLEVELYQMCRELFLAQYNYLRKILAYSKKQFDTIASEIECQLNTIFDAEFQVPICFINTVEDFGEICNILKEKLQIILHNFMITTFNNFKVEFYDSIMKKLEERKINLENNYCYKLILCSITYVNIMNSSTKIKLYKKLEELFKAYDNDEILKNNCIPIILNLYDLDDLTPIVFLREHIFNNEDYQKLFLEINYNEILLLNKKKEELYKDVVKFKNKLWNSVYNDLIMYFDYILPNIGRSLDYVKRQADYYNCKVEEYSVDGC